MVSQSEFSPLNANGWARVNSRLLNGICALALLVGASFYAQPAAALTTGFDDLTDSSGGFGGTPIPSGYATLNWTNFNVLNTADAAAVFGPSGATPGTVSPPNVAYNPDGGEAIFTSATHVPFNFTSADMTAVWNAGLSVEVIGKLGGVTEDDVFVTLSAVAATLETFNFANIDEVDFLASGGTPCVSCGYSGAGTQFALDNLTITSSTTAPTPLPAALPLFATGLGGLGLLGWRRKRKAQGAISHAAA